MTTEKIRQILIRGMTGLSYEITIVQVLRIGSDSLLAIYDCRPKAGRDLSAQRRVAMIQDDGAPWDMIGGEYGTMVGSEYGMIPTMEVA